MKQKIMSEICMVDLFVFTCVKVIAKSKFKFSTVFFYHSIFLPPIPSLSGENSTIH